MRREATGIMACCWRNTIVYHENITKNVVYAERSTEDYCVLLTIQNIRENVV